MRTIFLVIKKSYKNSGIKHVKSPPKLARNGMICHLSISGARQRSFWAFGYTKPNSWS
jgi:hypothetical protein